MCENECFFNVYHHIRHVGPFNMIQQTSPNRHFLRKFVPPKTAMTQVFFIQISPLVQETCRLLFILSIRQILTEGTKPPTPDWSGIGDFDVVCPLVIIEVVRRQIFIIQFLTPCLQFSIIISFSMIMYNRSGIGSQVVGSFQPPALEQLSPMIGGLALAGKGIVSIILMIVTIFFFKVCRQHQRLHLLFSLQPRNPAHNRVRKLFKLFAHEIRNDREVGVFLTVYSHFL